MRYLSFDLGTKTGACLNVNDDLYIMHVDLTPKRYESPGARYLRFQRYVENLLVDNAPVGLVLYEEVRRHLGTDAAHVYGGLLGVLQAVCAAHDVPFAGIPVQTAKKYVTNHGNASKDAVVAAVKALRPEIPGIAGMTEDEADAVAVMLAGVEQYGPQKAQEAA